MILATHALTGAVIGKNINSPWLIIILSLAIHYFMDSFRHGEYFDDRIANIKNTWWKVAIDLLIGLSIIGLVIYFQKPDFAIIRNMLIGSFFSLFPDFLSVLYYLKKDNIILSKIKSFHSWVHHYSKFPKHSKERQWNFRNALNDIIISVVAIFLLLL
jgi:hypothetical protein